MSMDPMYTDCLRELEQVKAERDALAAHVDRLRNEWNADDDFSDEWIIRMTNAFEDAPQTSLARRDLLKQAEAFEIAAKARCVDATLLRLNAADLRLQAEDLS